MIELQVLCKNGERTIIDMMSLQRVADGVSQIHEGWASTLTFSERLNAFIELSEAPPDIRGNSSGDAVEVDDEYAQEVYGKARQDLR